IASLTGKIQEEELPGQPQNALRDQRAQLVQQLAQIVEVREVESDGSYQLDFAGGSPLVLNGTAQTLAGRRAVDGTYAVIAANQDVTSQISSADLGAQLQLRDQVLPGYLDQLDQFAYQIAQQVNGIHSAAFDLNGNTGINFFAPLNSASGAASAIALNSDNPADSRQTDASQD